MTTIDDNPAEPDTEITALSHFESSVAELETLVEALESGDTDLEQALRQFERGTILARQCQDMLKQAELRIDQLTEDAAGSRVSAFDPPGADADGK